MLWHIIEGGGTGTGAGIDETMTIDPVRLPYLAYIP